jgi:hypothetical protein
MDSDPAAIYARVDALVTAGIARIFSLAALLRFTAWGAPRMKPS